MVVFIWYWYGSTRQSPVGSLLTHNHIYVIFLTIKNQRRSYILLRFNLKNNKY